MGIAPLVFMGAIAFARLSLLTVIEPQERAGHCGHRAVIQVRVVRSDIRPSAAGYVHAQVLHGPR